MRTAVVLAALLVNQFAAFSFASILKYEFTGIVAFSTDTGFAKGIPSFAPVTGHFHYDTTTPAVVDAGSDVYAQSLPGGFSVKVGTTLFTADDYDILISKNLFNPFPPPGKSTDVFEIRFSSLFNSPALLRDGASQPAGVLDISFSYPAGKLSGAGLPSSLPAPNFADSSGFFSSVPIGNIEAFLMMSTLTGPTLVVPEPSSLWLSVAGLLPVALYWRRSRTATRAGRLSAAKVT